MFGNHVNGVFWSSFCSSSLTTALHQLFLLPRVARVTVLCCVVNCLVTLKVLRRSKRKVRFGSLVAVSISLLLRLVLRTDAALDSAAAAEIGSSAFGGSCGRVVLGGDHYLRWSLPPLLLL